MRNATDYYNLLSDTLRNDYRQVICIYNKIDEARTKGTRINIRTGYLMNPKNYKKYNCFYRNKDIFPLCYQMSCCGFASKEVLNKILDFYQNCLLIYQANEDENQIKNIIKNEINNAKIAHEYLNKQNNGKDDFELMKAPPHFNEPQEKENSFNLSSYDENNESNSMKNFIDDREINESNEENDEENEEDDLSSLKQDEDNSKNESDLINTKKRRKLRKANKENEYKKELEDLMDNNYVDEPENYNDEEENNDNLLCQKRERGIVNDDESENEEQIRELLLKDLKQEKELLKKEGDKNKSSEENKEYFREIKKNINMKQKTLDAFLGI